MAAPLIQTPHRHDGGPFRNGHLPHRAGRFQKQQTRIHTCPNLASGAASARRDRVPYHSGSAEAVSIMPVVGGGTGNRAENRCPPLTLAVTVHLQSS